MKTQTELHLNEGADTMDQYTQERVTVEKPAEILSGYLKELGARISSLRKQRAMSQQQLADTADLDRTYISAVEHGKQNVTVGAITKLSVALKTRLEDLLVGAR